MGRPRSQPNVMCPQKRHARSEVIRWGTWKGKDGTRSKYRCTPLGEDKTHYFSVLTNPTGDQMVPVLVIPPNCPDPPLHARSRVRRDGKYASKGQQQRQRYDCDPSAVKPADRAPGDDFDTDAFPWRSRADPFAPHRFTPKLAREHVHYGVDHCGMCDVLTGVHSGTETVARTHRWNLPVVAQALINLATGTPYSEVSRWAKLHLAPKRRDARWAL